MVLKRSFFIHKYLLFKRMQISPLGLFSTRFALFGQYNFFKKNFRKKKKKKNVCVYVYLYSMFICS